MRNIQTSVVAMVTFMASTSAVELDAAQLDYPCEQLTWSKNLLSDQSACEGNCEGRCSKSYLTGDPDKFQSESAAPRCNPYIWRFAGQDKPWKCSPACSAEGAECRNSWEFYLNKADSDNVAFRCTLPAVFVEGEGCNGADPVATEPEEVEPEEAEPEEAEPEEETESEVIPEPEPVEPEVDTQAYEWPPCFDTCPYRQDAYGNTCTRYTEQPGYCWDHNAITSNFAPREDCCACGGGSIPDDSKPQNSDAWQEYYESIQAQEESEAASCADTAGAATDRYGDGCTFYDLAPGYCSDSYAIDSDFAPLDMCCSCGGGSSSGSSSGGSSGGSDSSTGDSGTSGGGDSSTGGGDSSTGDGGSTTGSTDKQYWVNRCGAIQGTLTWVTNRQRRLHGSPDVDCNAALAGEAQEWSDFLIGDPSNANDDKWEHSANADRQSPEPQGENLAYGWQTSSNQAQILETLESLAQMWYDEETLYTYNPPTGFSMATGHFTQVVWVATERVGFGVTQGDNGKTMLVGRYSPPGNYGNQFATNVLPLI